MVAAYTPQTRLRRSGGHEEVRVMPLTEYLAAFRRLPVLPPAFRPTGEPMTA
jgi:hypothetical protein